MLKDSRSSFKDVDYIRFNAEIILRLNKQYTTTTRYMHIYTMHLHLNMSIIVLG
jgi:hypothetical protein